MANWKYIMGATTIVLIVGGTIYAIKKSKDLEKDEEEAITADEAREIVSARRRETEEQTFVENSRRKSIAASHVLLRNDNNFRGDGEEDENYVEYAVEDVKVTNKIYKEITPEEEVQLTTNTTRPSMTSDEEDIFTPESEEEDYNFYEGVDFTQPLAETMTEEDKELKHEPSSIDARNQYMKMELAEWVPVEETYQTMLRMFEFPFEPKNDGDADLFTKLVDYRAQFFGIKSRWLRKISISDVILHFARLAVFNLGEDMRYWVNYFLGFVDFNHDIPSRVVDEMLLELNNHTYFNEERTTFGLFGLSRQSMDQAIQIANRNIDRSVTYEIEFNEFLKSCL